jgi:hypothetical protein
MAGGWAWKNVAPLALSFGPSCAIAAPTPSDKAATAANPKVLNVFIVRLLLCGPQTILATSAARRTFSCDPAPTRIRCAISKQTIIPNNRKWLLPQTEEYSTDRVKYLVTGKIWLCNPLAASKYRRYLLHLCKPVPLVPQPVDAASGPRNEPNTSSIATAEYQIINVVIAG